MKNFLLYLLVALVALPGFAQDFSYTYKGNTLTYTVTNEAGSNTCKVKSGTVGNIHASHILEIPETVEYSGTIFTVTSIGDAAFWDCSGLSTVLIPKSVTSIGDRAFSNCNNLSKAAYPSTIKNPFTYGFGIAYDRKTALIEDGFVYGPKKSSILFAPISLSGEYITPNSVTSIGDYAFYNCYLLTSVIITSSVTSVGKDAFNECRGLLRSAYPATIERPFRIGFRIEYNPYNAMLEDGFIYGPNKSSILFAPISLSGEYTIPNSVSSIERAAFSECRGLCSVTIPNSVTLIGNSAFESCSGLTSVTIPNSVLEINSSTFSKCSGLTSVVIPNSVDKIGSSAFEDCWYLSSVMIPNSVYQIGSRAFQGSSLKEVFSLIEDPFDKGSLFGTRDVFDNWTLENGTLYVPKGTIYKYKQSYVWNDFSNIIEKDMSSVDEIGIDDKDATFSIYNMNGVMLLNNCTLEHLSTLPKGIYIKVSGNKYTKIIL